MFFIRHLSLHSRCQIKKGQLLTPYFVCPRFTCQTLKNSKILFSSHGASRTSRMTWHNPFRHQSTRSAFFSQNAPSQPWVWSKVKRDQNPYKTKLFMVLHQTRASRRFLTSLTRSQSWMGLKILILIQLLERVETNVIVKIIKFSFQWLFMGQNWS